VIDFDLDGFNFFGIGKNPRPHTYHFATVLASRRKHTAYWVNTAVRKYLRVHGRYIRARVRFDGFFAPLTTVQLADPRMQSKVERRMDKLDSLINEDVKAEDDLISALRGWGLTPNHGGVQVGSRIYSLVQTDFDMQPIIAIVDLGTVDVLA
jgi:hypothetical protein